MHEKPLAFPRAVAGFLESRGWSWGECSHCGVSFLAKPQRSLCGRSDCADLAFQISDAVTHRPRFPEQVWQAVYTFFSSEKFMTINRSDIANPSNRATRFVGAGLQIFEDGMERDAVPPDIPLFVPQPVIRLNYWDMVGLSTATSTSFVNLCTEHARSSLAEFLRHLGLWIDLIDNLRIRTHNITIILGSDRWHGGPFSGQCLSVEVNGTEVGDAILIDAGGAGATSFLPIADFSFGLERLVAAVNPNLQYSLFLGPLPESALPQNERAIDRIRTATLMCMSGVSPSSRGHGRFLRRAVSDALQQQCTIDFLATVSHAHNYWSQFITPKRDLHECQYVLESERLRTRAIEMVQICCGEVQGSCFSFASPNEACRRLIGAGKDISIIANCASVLDCRFRQTDANPQPTSDD